jgi:carbon monoxide dehydrogenase subunit G
MKLSTSFDVPVAPEQAWGLLLDLARVIPCMPGAELTETLGDSRWKGRLHVKVGPMALVFETDVRREDADHSALRATFAATARELKGRGGGQARLDASLASVDAGTSVHVETDLALSGVVAQTARPIVESMSDEFVSSLAACLRVQLTGSDEEAAAAREAQAAPVNGHALAVRAVWHHVDELVHRLTHRL